MDKLDLSEADHAMLSNAMDATDKVALAVGKMRLQHLAEEQQATTNASNAAAKVNAVVQLLVEKHCPDREWRFDPKERALYAAPAKEKQAEDA